MLVGVASAHAGSLGSVTPVSVPSWLFALTGGAVVVASFLFTSLLTDRDLIRAVNERGPTVQAPRALALGRRLLAAVGVVGLLAVVVVGLFVPAPPVANLAVLLVWVAWWAGYTTTVYLVGNTWPALNPFRTLAGSLPTLDRPLPARLATWPSVVGLLALVWLEVVSPLADAPRLLAGVAVGYTLLTLAGAVVFGSRTWFERVDPVSRVFRFYGALAPVQRVREGFVVGLPGAGLLTHGGTEGVVGRRRSPDGPVRADGGVASTAAHRGRSLVSGGDDVAFVVALLWTTTFDGFVSTQVWADLAGPAVEWGAPPLAVYLAALVGGFGLFFGGYRLASALARRSAGSYVTSVELERRFAVALLPIAAGYHLAHFAGYFLTFSPALAAVLAAPLSPPANPLLVVLPDWFGAIQLSFVVLGHLLGVWVAHSVAFETFTGRLQPLRSQYPYVVVMAAYTMTSMWLLMQPYTAPPFL
ncbi:hypothetical protein GQS65_15775 [Halomarina oriensis]|uniref:Uncharacterized protein n=1 Tax=Halomarina oriensis TaxID=671145 RepID=A0A6B0GUV7_9EURY|nr:hypothetical protein [Halomarina oriensis]